jgi:integrase
MKLTQASIGRFSLPRGKSEVIVFDDELPGFGLRVRAGGSRNWIVQYKVGPKQRRMTLGSVAMLNVAKARDAAKTALAKVRLGNDPANEKAVARLAAGETLGAVATRYLSRQEARLRPSSYGATERYLLKHFASLHGLALSKINRATVAAALSKIAEDKGAVSADRARAALSAMFTWAVKEGLCETNLVAGTNTASEGRARDRVLSDDELVTIWKALPDNHYRQIVRLLILTGCRRDEIGSLRWSEIDLEARLLALPGERTKNHRAHEVPLGESALAILEAIPRRWDRDLVFGVRAGGFSGWGKAKELTDRALMLKPWRLHDVRRTVATRMADLGIQPHIIEAVLNHVSGHKAGVAGVYNRSTYAAEKRAALEIWANHVAVILAQAGGENVRRLKRA